jgi:O-antigen/teichoic acid export membrane protein
MNRAAKLLSGSAWNMAGQVLPLLVAVATIPWLISAVGLERFGFIALAWVLVGYASLFDLGIGRAVIRTVSARLAQGDREGADASGQAGLSFLLLLGLVVMAFTLLGTPLLVDRVLVVPTSLQGEAQGALRLLALSLPFVMLTSGYVGVLSAYQDFRLLNLVRALFSVLSYALPLAVALAGWATLPAVVGTIVALRAAGTVAFAWACARHHGFRWWPRRPPREQALELLQLGGWMSVSNVVGPLLTYLDRLLIAALVPLRAVGIYSAPYDLATRMLVIPYSIVAALFPMSAALQPGSPQAGKALSDITRYLFLSMFPLMFGTLALAHPAMRLWLGAEVGEQAAVVLQILAVGVFLNALTQGPATLIQAAGKPRDMALLHLAELPLFLAVLWALTTRLGIVGTALAASLRFAVDAAAVFWLAHRGFVMGPWPWRAAARPALLALALFAAALPCRSWLAALGVLVIGGLVFATYGWQVLLASSEKSHIAAWLSRRRH